MWRHKKRVTVFVTSQLPQFSKNINSALTVTFHLKELTIDGNRVFKHVKIAVPLKYLSKFWRSSEMPLINFKIYFELNWSRDCVMSTIADTTLKIINTTLCVPVVTLSSKDNVKLVKLLKEGFKRPAYWNWVLFTVNWVRNKNRNKKFRQ